MRPAWKILHLPLWALVVSGSCVTILAWRVNSSSIVSFLPGLVFFMHRQEEAKRLTLADLQVISRVRVFQDDPSNHFRSLVVPLCIAQGPLRYAVLSLSANDRRRETNVDYGQVALSYKSRSLRLLRESLAGMDHANEALMTCLILCSLEIACGSRTDWVRHARGAFAIINNFADVVDPQILFFVYSYFQSRRIFFLTTSASGQLDEAESATTATNPAKHAKSASTSSSSEMQDLPSLKLDFEKLCINQMQIQAHIGCSLGLLDIIAQTTRLVRRKRQQRQSGRNSLTNEETIRSKAMSIRSQLESLVEENPSGNDYLSTCAECFRVAADLFLQLACDVPLHQVFLQERLCYLLGRIGRVVYEGQQRQLFPMWPLFLAGCLSSSDEDRLRVLDYFAVLSQQWPVSNIPVVQEATETIWKSRDLNPDSKARDGFDWQIIIEQMNWKLALS